MNTSIGGGPPLAGAAVHAGTRTTAVMIHLSVRPHLAPIYSDVVRVGPGVRAAEVLVAAVGTLIAVSERHGAALGELPSTAPADYGLFLRNNAAEQEAAAQLRRQQRAAAAAAVSDDDDIDGDPDGVEPTASGGAARAGQRTAADEALAPFAALAPWVQHQLAIGAAIAAPLRSQLQRWGRQEQAAEKRRRQREKARKAAAAALQRLHQAHPVGAGITQFAFPVDAAVPVHSESSGDSDDSGSSDGEAGGGRRHPRRRRSTLAGADDTQRTASGTGTTTHGTTTRTTSRITGHPTGDDSDSSRGGGGASSRGRGGEGRHSGGAHAARRSTRGHRGSGKKRTGAAADNDHDARALRRTRGAVKAVVAACCAFPLREYLKRSELDVLHESYTACQPDAVLLRVLASVAARRGASVTAALEAQRTDLSQGTGAGAAGVATRGAAGRGGSDDVTDSAALDGLYRYQRSDAAEAALAPLRGLMSAALGGEAGNGFGSFGDTRALLHRQQQQWRDDVARRLLACVLRAEAVVATRPLQPSLLASLAGAAAAGPVGAEDDDDPSLQKMTARERTMVRLGQRALPGSAPAAIGRDPHASSGGPHRANPSPAGSFVPELFLCLNAAFLAKEELHRAEAQHRAALRIVAERSWGSLIDYEFMWRQRSHAAQLFREKNAVTRTHILECEERCRRRLRQRQRSDWTAAVRAFHARYKELERGMLAQFHLMRQLRHRHTSHMQQHLPIQAE